MFSSKLLQKQQQMLETLLNSRHKGLNFLEFYFSPDRNQALNLLKMIELQTIREIKQDLQKIQSQNRQVEQFKLFCSNFYYTARSYSIKSNKRNWALFGIFAFSVIECLCAWGLFKTVTYYFIDHGQSAQEVFDSSFWNILGTLGKFIGIFVLGSYSAAGLWHGTAFLIWCIQSYLYRKKQSKQLKEQMKQEIRRHQI